MPPSEEITFILGRLEGKVDSLLSISSQQSAAIAKHDERIRRLENYKAYVLGITVTVATITSLITYFLGAL